MATPSHPHFLWLDIFGKKKTRVHPLAQALRENILFSTLNEKELLHLSTVVYERNYQTEESIFKQGERGFGMYLIAEGSVAIKTQPPEGEILVTRLKKGSFFGELSLVDEENIRSASAISQEKTTLIGFFKPDLLEILERKPSMGVKILLQLSVVLGRRLLRTTERISVLAKALGMSQVHDDVV